jgi:hypothetical protein
VLSISKRLRWAYYFLGSKELAAVLFPLLCLTLVPVALAEQRSVFLGGLLNFTLGFIGLNLLLCTLQRIRSLTKPVLAIHFGALLVLIGGVVSSLGFVATVNMYEGTSVDKAYRWDRREDMPLATALTVKKIHTEYYPVPIKIGVLRGDKKCGLFVLKTGESFNLDGYTVKVVGIELPSKNLQLKVFAKETFIGSANTSGTRDLPPGFPYDFKLVAYQDPIFKRVWVDLMLTRESKILAEGTSEVNHPLSCEGLDYYLTKVDRDSYLMSFAGVQITKDPGRPYVYAGFGVMGIGCLALLRRRTLGRN